jgi:Tfp pilus assembly protein PilF
VWAALAAASLLLGVCMIGLVVASDGLDSDEEIARRLARFTGTDAGTGALRLIFWKNTLAMARDHPWLGVGPANFALQYPRYHRAAEVDWTFDEEHQLERAHNDHLQVLAERGLPGFAAWVSIFFVALLSVGKLLREPEPWIRLQTLFVGLGIVAFAVVACFSFPAERALPPIQLCALLGMLGSLHVASRREPVRELRIPPWVRSVMVVTLVAYLATSVGVARRTMLSDIHLTEGLRRMHAGQYEGAAVSLEKARAATPHDADVLLMLAGNLAALDRSESALQILREVLQVHPYKVNAISNMGYCHLKLREYAEARRWFEAALEILPDSPELHTNLGTTHAEQGDHDLAIEAYLEAVELAETTPFLPGVRIETRRLQPRLLLAREYVARGRFVEAIAQYETILEREPEMTDVRRLLTELHREIEKAE